jgi:hypothetical protein
MNDILEAPVSRKQIAIRFLYTLFFLAVLEILKIIIQLIVIFQFVLLFVLKGHSEPVRDFSNRVVAYAYGVMRYVSLNDNLRPFPFSDFPDKIEPPAGKPHFM